MCPFVFSFCFFARHEVAVGSPMGFSEIPGHVDDDDSKSKPFAALGKRWRLDTEELAEDWSWAGGAAGALREYETQKLMPQLVQALSAQGFTFVAAPEFHTANGDGEQTINPSAALEQATKSITNLRWERPEAIPELAEILYADPDRRAWFAALGNA